MRFSSLSFVIVLECAYCTIFKELFFFCFLLFKFIHTLYIENAAGVEVYIHFEQIKFTIYLLLKHIVVAVCFISLFITILISIMSSLVCSLPFVVAVFMFVLSF